MKTLVLDTCHKYMIVGCFENEKCVGTFSQKAWKKQSEIFFEALNRCMEKAKWGADDIDQVVVTEGPGSYTGERIAMTFAKVFCTQKQVTLYTVSTFLIYAGQQSCEVILDARSQRAYCGRCENGKLMYECIKTLDEIKKDIEAGIQVIGDDELLDGESQNIDFVANFMAVKESWIKVENIHTLTPHYLKEKEELVQ